MKEWPALCSLEWDTDDLAAAVVEYQPAGDYCACLAVQPEIVALDADILNLEHAAFAAKLADNILGVTPLIRIGLEPKCIRVYRAGDLIRSRKAPSYRNLLRLRSIRRLRLACESRPSVPLAAQKPAHHQHR